MENRNTEANKSSQPCQAQTTVNGLPTSVDIADNSDWHSAIGAMVGSLTTEDTRLPAHVCLLGDNKLYLDKQFPSLSILQSETNTSNELEQTQRLQAC